MIDDPFVTRAVNGERFEEVKGELENAIKQDTRQNTTLKNTDVKKEKEGAPVGRTNLSANLLVVVEN